MALPVCAGAPDFSLNGLLFSEGCVLFDFGTHPQTVDSSDAYSLKFGWSWRIPILSISARKCRKENNPCVFNGDGWSLALVVRLSLCAQEISPSVR